MVGAGTASAAPTATSSADRLVRLVNNQIELVDLDTDQAHVVGSRLSFASATLSPDGTDVVANESGGYDMRSGRYVDSRGLFLVDVDASASRQLTTGVDQDPAWSPDGQWIAFVRKAGSPKRSGLYVIRPNGTDLRLVKAGSVSTPAWSPDGKEIAFDYSTGTGWDAANSAWRHSTASLSVITPAGSRLRRLTTHRWTESTQPIDDSAPMWSPDGSRIAFDRTIGVGDKGGSLVYVINRNGTGLTRITPAGYFSQPSGWSPDGTHLAGWRSKICNACSAGFGPAEAWVTNLSDGAISALTAYGAVQWSPAGEFVGFGCTAAQSGVCVISPDGSVVKAVVGTPIAGSSSPSVQGIVVDGQSAVAGRGHTYNIAALATDSRTGEPVQGVRVIKVLKASLGTASQVGSSSIRYTAPSGTTNKKVVIHFVATFSGSGGPVPGVLILLILAP